MTAVLAKDVLARRGLIIAACSFRCPWCHRAFQRGGHKEGFVKSGAINHVFSCWEILLWQRGYAPGDWSDDGQKAIPLEKLDDAQRARHVRSVRANLSRRRRQGNVPAVPKGAAA